MPILHDFVDAVPTAELEPRTETYVQSDEADMGITYAELTAFGKLRKVSKLGPYSCFRRLLNDWKTDRPEKEGDDAPRMTPREIANKTKFFFHYYAINRYVDPSQRRSRFRTPQFQINIAKLLTISEIRIARISSILILNWVMFIQDSLC